MECPVCSETFHDSEDLELHVNAHFDDTTESYEEEGVPGESVEIYGLSSTEETTTQTVTDDDPHGYDFDGPDTRPDASLIDDGTSRTTYPFMKLSDVSNLLCSPCDHFSSSGKERGRCGYKNIQMVLSAMVRQPRYRNLVFNGKDWFPSILKIQQMIELAWQSGFDATGAKQLRGSLQNTRKWIGATEVATLFSALSIRCRIVEFAEYNGGHHGRRLFQWIRNHFEEQTLEFRCPIYLQYSGHSLTVIGVNLNKRGLLVLNPSIPPDILRRWDDLQLQHELFVSADDFDDPQYQMVVVDGLMASEEEYEDAKNPENIRMPMT